MTAPALALHINYGPPTRVIKQESAGPRWCFKDRRRFNHEWVLIGYTQPSYYDPYWVCLCSHCGEDHTEFPR